MSQTISPNQENLSDPADGLNAESNRSLTQVLGWFSIGLGVVEFIAPGTVARLTGVRHPRLLQVYGLREIVSGVGILTSRRPSDWLWSRVAGDAVDLATLAIDAKGMPAVLSALAVAGVSMLDAFCASKAVESEAGAKEAASPVVDGSNN